MATKTFTCRDIGMDCGFEARASTEAELMDKIAEHAKKAHNMAEIDAGTRAKIKGAIRTNAGW